MDETVTTNIGGGGGGKDDTRSGFLPDKMIPMASYTNISIYRKWKEEVAKYFDDEHRRAGGHDGHIMDEPQYSKLLSRQSASN